MNRRLITATLLGLAGLATAAPAAAQDDPGEKVNQVIIYGDDECPQSAADTITVCARMDESERYRIPERLRFSEDPANKSWTDKVKSFETVGAFGPLSCSTVGNGSELGCTAAFIEAAYAEKAQASEVRFSQLISEARQERLSEIDAEAAATQSRVEELERAYDERIAREQDAASGVDGAPLPSPAERVDPARLASPPPAP